MLDIGIGGALIAGFLSFISPCVLPIVPPYLAYLAGLSFSQLSDEAISSTTARRIIQASIFFVLGFTTVFVALGATASFIGQSIAQHFGTLSIIAGVLIIIMGLHFLGVFKIGFLYREARVDVKRKDSSFIGSYIMGLAFAFGWTPCVGPVLAAILFVAGSEETSLRGATLLGAYSLGIGIPFILSALFVTRFLHIVNKFKRHLRKVEIAMGLFLILTGVLFVTGSMSRIAQWLLETFPVFSTIG